MLSRLFDHLKEKNMLAGAAVVVSGIIAIMLYEKYVSIKLHKEESLLFRAQIAQAKLALEKAGATGSDVYKELESYCSKS